MKLFIQCAFILFVLNYLFDPEKIPIKYDVFIRQESIQVKGMDNNNCLIIRKLGYVDDSDLKDAVNIIKDFFGYKCIIKSGVSISKEMELTGEEGILNAEDILDEVKKYKKTLFIVDKKIKHEGNFLRGFTDGITTVVRGEKSFLRETIIHELGHTLGLHHCVDKTCVMALDNDEYDSGTFCEKCRKRIKFKN